MLNRTRSATNKATSNTTTTSTGLSGALYEGQSVVLTGSTGFVGLRTLKTLLTHTEVDDVILPIRVKGDLRNGEGAAIIRFYRVLSKYGEGLDLSIDDPRLCIVPMSSGKYLDGVSRAPKDIIEKCSTILHIAASTDWDGSIDDKISTDMEPTMNFLEGSSDMLPNLKSFVFTSTAFVEDKDKVSRDMPLPEGPLNEVSGSGGNYFSNYAKVKALTEHAIESYVLQQSRVTTQANCDTASGVGSNSGGVRVAIVRPGNVAPSIGLDGVPVGWRTDNKSLAAGIKLYHESSTFGNLFETYFMFARKGVDTGVIPVDHVANMIVLTGGNCNLKGINGKPFYLNVCSPSALEPKWDTFFGKKITTDSIFTYKNDIKEALKRAETELGYSKPKMILLEAYFKKCEYFFSSVFFHDWAFETNNQGLLYDGLSPEYREMMPISFENSEEMNAWVDEIMLKIGEKKQVDVKKSSRRFMRSNL